MEYNYNKRSMNVMKSKVRSFQEVKSKIWFLGSIRVGIGLVGQFGLQPAGQPNNIGLTFENPFLARFTHKSADPTQ